MENIADDHLFPTYKRWELTFQKAHGSRIIADGREFLDFMTGIGTVNMGHGHPAVTEAVEGQLRKGWHASNLFHYDEQKSVAKKLAHLSGLDFVFFANSGSEANEAAIKLARKATGREEIITFEQSFHGRTYGSMAATGQPKVRDGYAPLPTGFTYVPYNDIEALEAQLSSRTAAVMLEVVQGEGGVIPGTETFLQEAQKCTKEYGALLIIDEIQTGIGRTGYPFSFQKYDLQPDIITLAKGIGNGFPTSAMLGSSALKEAFGPGSHGTTFGGNPLAMAAVNATLALLTDELLKEVKEKGERAKKFLQQELKEVNGVKEVRGIGLMLGIELTGSSVEVIRKLQDQGILALQAGESVVRILPALNIEENELMSGLESLIETLKETSS